MSPGAPRDPAARRALFEAVAAVVFEPLQRYLLRRADPDDAADVLADALLVVWRRLDDVPDDPLPWSYGVARRCLANHRRGDRRHLRLVERAGSQPPPTPTGDPQRAVDALDPELVAALDTLTPSEREIVHLWAWEQLAPREIATVLDMSSNAVSVALSRAKRKLAEQLDRQDHRDPGHLHGADTTEPEGGPR